MRQEQLTIEIVPGVGYVTLCLAGEIDMSNAAAVRDAALDAIRQHATTIFIDLGRVTFMDSTGLEVLLATRRRTELEGGHLRLIDPCHAVLRVLEVTGVSHLFDVVPGAASEAVRLPARPQIVGPLPA